MPISMFPNPAFSIRQIQYAVAVAQTEGFGTAAVACGVSQPSLSAQVSKLETVLGVQLFERHARGIHITQAGEQLLPRMRQMLRDTRAFAEAARTLSDPAGITLRIGVIPTVAPYLLPSVVELIRAQPTVPRVHWLELQTHVCESSLASGDIDAMVIADPPTLPSVEHVELGWETFYAVVPEDHALRGPITLGELSKHELLLLEDGHCLRDQTMDLCMAPGAQESPFRATSLPTLIQMVSAGLGITVLPASAIATEAKRAPVRAVALKAQDVGRTLHMAWRARSPHGPVITELSSIVRAGLEAAIGLS